MVVKTRAQAARFNLLRLPSLPIEEILKCMQILDLLTLCECSTKSRFLVKLVERKVVSHYKLFISLLGGDCSIGFESQSTGMVSVPLADDPWPTDAIARAQTECDRILTIFKGMKVRAELYLDLNLIFDWAVKHKDSMEHIDYLGATRDRWNMQRFLETFNNVAWSYGRARGEWRSVRLTSGSWLYTESMKNFVGRCVVVVDASLTNADVSRLLNDWKSGVWNSSSRLKFVLIQNETMEIPTILEGIPHRTHNVAPHRAIFRRTEAWHVIKHDVGTELAKVYRMKELRMGNVVIHFSR